MATLVNRVYFVNPENLDEIFEFDGKDYNIIEITDIKSGSYIASKINYNDLIFHSFKISNHTPETEIGAAVEIRMFEDLNLDLNKEYIIKYSKKELSFDNSYQIDSFAVVTDLLNEKYKTLIKKIKYIDYITTPRLAFETLYNRNFLEKKIDLFINIDKNESFALLYKNGKFVSSITIPTLKNIEKKFIGVSKLNAAEISDILSIKGFLDNSYKDEDKKIFDMLQTTFIEIVSKINNIITNSRGKFGISEINRVYIGVEGKRILGVNSIFELSGMNKIEVKTLDIIPNARKINPINAICATYAFDKLRDGDNLSNLTIFHRQPPFLKTYVGKFILMSFFLIPLLLSYPLYLKYYLMQLEDKNFTLQIKLDNLLRDTKILKERIKYSKDLLSHLKDEKDDLNRKTKILDDTVIKLKNIKMTDEYSSMLININEFLDKYKLKTNSIEQTKEFRNNIGIYKMSVEVISKNQERENIGKFMSELLFERNGVNEMYTRTYTDEIKLDDNYYKSIIRIEK